MRSLIVVALSLTVVAVAGCSGSDDADPTTTSGTVAPQSSSTPPDTDTDAATTATNTGTTSVPPTTEAPTTTLDPTAALVADIEADLNAGEQAFLAAGADPANAELRAVLERYYSGNSLGAVTQILDGFVSDGRHVSTSSEIQSFLEVESIEEVDEPPSAVVAILCRVDGAVVVADVGTSEAVVDDQIYNTTSRSRLFLVDDIWRLDGGTTIDEQVGVTTCE